MKHLRVVLAFLLAVVLGCAPMFAQSQDAPFTDRELAKLIADWPGVVQWLEAQGRRLDAAASSGAALAAAFTGSDFEAFLRSKGWTLSRFSYVAGAAFMLTAYVTFERQNPEALASIDQAIAETRSNLQMTAEQKAQTIQGLEEARKSLLAIPAEANLNEAELKLVRARYDSLYKVLEESSR